MVPCQDGSILAIVDKEIYRCEGVERAFIPVHRFRRGRRPLLQGWCLTHTGDFLYGEYFYNTEREQVLLWRSSDFGLSWEVVYRFPPNSVRHIHSVQEDPYTGDIWVSTGDEDRECLVMRFSSCFKEYTIVGQGSQDWRLVSLIFGPEYVYWGTDAPQQTNKLIRWSRKTRVAEVVAQVNGPVYYSQQTREGVMLFGTSVEGGRGEIDNRAWIWGSVDGMIWEPLWKTQKDRWNNTLFGHGVLLFVRSSQPLPRDSIWVTGQALREFDNISVCFSLSSEGI
ncbi:MAG: hypothetical protein D6711_17140 [Chloroflexi bacterium]|nr:MAG: hypothetical protein D6711_17140 [Chloroflexota bacterium]